MKGLFRFCNSMYLLGLSLWVSGMFFIGILAEIVVRVKLKEQPITASVVMQGLGTAFNIYIVKYICITILLAEAIRWWAGKTSKAGFVYKPITRWRYTREVCLAVMMTLALYMGSSLRPEMQEIDRQKKEVQRKTLTKAEVNQVIKSSQESLTRVAQAEDTETMIAELLKLNPSGKTEVILERNPGDDKLKIQFDAYHQRFEWLFAINMILGLTCLVIHAKELTRFKDE